MAFKLDQSETFEWPVKVDMPAGGSHTQHKFTAHFRRLTQDQINEMSRQDDGDFLREVLSGWKGVVDDDEKEVPFSEDARDRMLQIPEARIGLMSAYFEAIGGRHGKRGN
jgi:hypothetical protein